ncbi:MAG: ATP-dependent DNA helicase [Candidatus Marsarchaeota archaeon]|nr:ATP-dependent DNA helicase [Candidatus Marsarchaeota archaeon]MCL5431273.1 ATP-dependent DNA helicase [Candidatus Marsarchaeota archaeon]
MISDIYAAMQQRKSILVNAPTGIGKTDAALSAAMTYALDNDLDVFFLTPKISQHAIAVEALRGISSKFGGSFSFIDLVGKANLCTNEAANMLPSESFYPTCEKLIAGKKCAFYTKFKGLDELPQNLVASAGMGHHQFFREAFSEGLCGYYSAIRAARKSQIIVADYAHMLNPYTRSVFLKSISHSLSNSIVIWDEAHNIVSLASDYLSSSITYSVIERAQKELDEIGSSIDVSYIGFVMKSVSQRKLTNVTEAFIERADFPKELEDEAESLADSLEKRGMEYLEKSAAKRSSLVHLSRFLRAWSGYDETATRIISRHGPSIRISIKSLFPKKSLEVLREPYANIFMSATMAPISMYSDMFMLDGAVSKNYESPFPKANRIAFIDGSITTKYESRSVEEYKKIAERIEEFRRHIPGNIAVFFPSFKVLEGTARHLSMARMIVQGENMSSAATGALLERFAASRDTVLLAVMGGSLSEGVDYRDNLIKGIVIVGIPLSMPDLETRARIAVFEKQFGSKGFEYAYITPAIIRAIQAAGRAVRNETDRAVILFLDKRYTWRGYSNLIEGSIGISKSLDYMGEIDKFWGHETSSAGKGASDVRMK